MEVGFGVGYRCLRHALEHANYIGIDGETLGTLGDMRHIVRGGMTYMRTLGSHREIRSIGVITCWKAHHPRGVVLIPKRITLRRCFILGVG
jgi:hypothetical protein